MDGTEKGKVTLTGDDFPKPDERSRKLGVASRAIMEPSSSNNSGSEKAGREEEEAMQQPEEGKLDERKPKEKRSTSFLRYALEEEKESGVKEGGEAASQSQRSTSSGAGNHHQPVAAQPGAFAQGARPAFVAQGQQQQHHHHHHQQQQEQQQPPHQEEEDLVEALPVLESNDDGHNGPSVVQMEEAELVDLQQEANRKANKEKLHRKSVLLFGFIAFACLVVALAIGLVFGLAATAAKEEEEEVAVVVVFPTAAPSQSPTNDLPPMENLERLYDDLPQKTRIRLRNSTSPQYLAWEWLLDHPDISSYPEWRKRQIYAMVTLFFSLEGPKWEEVSRVRWLNTSISECWWAMTEAEVEWWTQASFVVTHGQYDLHPCNEDGVLQTILLAKGWVSTTSNNDIIIPTIPPEIEFLSTLTLFMVGYAPLKTTLSDLLVPELANLPNLQFLGFPFAEIRGTLPTNQLMKMTGLKHLLLSTNQLTGTIPSKLGISLSNLEFFSIFRNNLMGTIPTEMGSLTALTTMFLSYNAITGNLPSELGLMENFWSLNAAGNQLKGTIPTELGILTNMGQLLLSSNDLTGLVPSQLGTMTKLFNLQLGNGGIDLQGAMDNNFNGSVPTELWELSNLQLLSLSDLPLLSGSIPDDLQMPHLETLDLSGSPFISGTIPEEKCNITTLEFDCSNILCGCNCTCNDGGNETIPGE